MQPSKRNAPPPPPIPKDSIPSSSYQGVTDKAGKRRRLQRGLEQQSPAPPPPPAAPSLSSASCDHSNLTRVQLKGPIAASAASSGAAAHAAFIPIVDPIEKDMADRVQQALRALERADKTSRHAYAQVRVLLEIYICCSSQRYSHRGAVR